MTITVEIGDELGGKLAAEAQARGLDVPAYARTLLEQAAQPGRRQPKDRNLEEFEKTLDRIAQFSHKIPRLPDEALSRESLYQDHD